jgi:hypothetical protein
VLTSHWFPELADLGGVLLWLVATFTVYLAVLIGSMFVLVPDVDLVPPHGPIRLDI